MSAITELAKVDWRVLLLMLFTVAFAIKEIIEIILYYKKKFRIRTGNEEDKETVEIRITTLEQHDKVQHDEITKILKCVEDIIERLDERDNKDKEKTVATLRNQLYDLHNKFIERGSVDQSGLKTFLELGKIYEEAGGDDVYHDKLKPEVMDLPIVTDN